MVISVPEAVHKKRSLWNQQCQQAIRRADAEGTRHNHRTHYSTYLRFCNEYMYQPFPANEWRYCQFTQFLAQENKQYGTIQNYCSTVHTLHRLDGWQVPQHNQIHFIKMIENLKKNRKQPIKQAAPMTHEILVDLFPYVDISKEVEAVAWVAVLVGFPLILRVSNLGPPTRVKFNPDKHFVRNDLDNKQGYLTLSVRWSKTIQHKIRSSLPHWYQPKIKSYAHSTG